jgi:hypothetical protein
MSSHGRRSPSMRFATSVAAARTATSGDCAA